MAPYQSPPNLGVASPFTRLRGFTQIGDDLPVPNGSKTTWGKCRVGAENCRVFNASHLQFSHEFSRVQGHAGNKIIFIIIIIITGVQWGRATLSNLYHLNTIPRHGICTSTSAIPHGATAMLQPLVWPAVSPTCIVSTNQWWRESSQWTLSESECFCVWGYNLKYSYFLSTSYSFTTLWFSFQLHLTKQKKLATTPWWQPRSNERNSNFHCRWVWISWQLHVFKPVILG